MPQAGFQIVSMVFFVGFCWGVNDVYPANQHFNNENYDEPSRCWGRQSFAGPSRTHSIWKTKE